VRSVKADMTNTWEGPMLAVRSGCWVAPAGVTALVCHAPSETSVGLIQTGTIWTWTPGCHCRDRNGGWWHDCL